MFDRVIRHGTVIDASNTPRRRADVAAQVDRIVEVGAHVARGQEEIDASGHSVTTCVFGNCGLSLGPLPDGKLPEPLSLFASALGSRFTTAQAYLLEALRGQATAVNSVPLLGHSSLRASVMDRIDRPATDREVAAMRGLAHLANVGMTWVVGNGQVAWRGGESEAQTGRLLPRHR